MKAFEQYITEIGDSRKPYSFTLKTKRSQYADDYIICLAKFKSDSGLHYDLDALYSPEAGTLDVGFETAEKGYNVTDAGLGEAFRVMATVISITKEIILKRLWKLYKLKTNRVDFQAAGENKTGADQKAKIDQRMKLYTAFIKKELPGGKLFTKFGRANVMIPDNFYK